MRRNKSPATWRIAPPAAKNSACWNIPWPLPGRFGTKQQAANRLRFHKRQKNRLRFREASGQRRRIVRRPLAWIGGAVAISAAVILLLFGQSVLSLFKSPGISHQPIELVKNNATQYAPARPNEDVDVMEYIAREERSARLAASVQIMADRPELAQYKADAERYLKEHYADTAAVRMLEKQQTTPQ